MSSGLQSLETLAAAGARLAKTDFASTYEFEWNGSAVAKIRPGGACDLAMVNKEGIVHCYDANTCKTRWTIDLGTKAIKTRSIDDDSGVDMTISS